MRIYRFRLICLLAVNACMLAQATGQDIPRSIILVVADGAGIGHYTLSYYHNDSFAPATFQHVGLSTTHPADSGRVTDSAASGTALSAGVKTNNGLIALDVDSIAVKTVLEYAQEKGMATGLVATYVITHATPAVFAAHVDNRYDYPEIARQMLDAKVDVLFGGGRRLFLSEEEGGPQAINLLDSIAAEGVQVIDTLDGTIDESRPVIGLFADGDLPHADRDRQPTTTAMALQALEILDNDPDGFFLMVEESQVDGGGHANNYEYARSEMASLNDLIDAMLAYQASHPEVLVLLVSDHDTGGLAMQNRFISYIRQRIIIRRWFFWRQEMTSSDNQLIAGWTSRDHTSNMVPIFATGPGSEVFDAVVDNIFIGQTLIEYVTSR